MAENIDGLILIETKTFSDNRGYFRETYRNNNFIEMTGSKGQLVQDNESLSTQIGVLRGLHFQKAPHAQAKLVRIVTGSVFDVAVDLRPASRTFKQWRAFELSAENGLQLFIPGGFAHGFCTLAEHTIVNYKVSDYYVPQCDSGIKWNDPELNIPWPIDSQSIIVSEKDASLPFLSQIELRW